ncbi:MAG: hypothetical protein PHG66_05195 [Candidatus Colwellbacteria bacterium]|nr:hypothetical protein [Candidatus Colwellbacteria bacterium]
MRDGYTGKLLELEYLGYCKDVLGNREFIAYMPFKDSVRNAMQRQPWEDPSDPAPRFASDLHCLLAEELGLDDYHDLEFYTSVGTSLDLYHGVDAFFRLKRGNTWMMVTMDLTMNPEKVEYKADVVVQYALTDTVEKLKDMARVILHEFQMKSAWTCVLQ